jgi:3-oxoacyl-[acyl-carrier protein] reductase
MDNQDLGSLDGQVAFVTGGSGGIGGAICARLAKEGATVVVADIDLAAAEKTVAEISERGHEARVQVLDVANPASVDASIAGTVSALGKIDILVHCAAVFARARVLDMDYEDWTRVIDVNLNGTFLISKAVGAHMEANRFGTILMIASDRGILGGEGNSNYAASKGGMIAFMRSLALELAPAGVTVNAVNPGATDTKRQRTVVSEEFIRHRRESDPLGKLSQPEEIAGLVHYLVSPAARFITGQLVTTRVRRD